jgi:hypothetical protein
MFNLPKRKVMQPDRELLAGRLTRFSQPRKSGARAKSNS